MKYCKRCAQMTWTRQSSEFLVVKSPKREVLKRFASFGEAQDWAKSCGPHVRVEEIVVSEKCGLCGKSR